MERKSRVQEFYERFDRELDGIMPPWDALTPKQQFAWMTLVERIDTLEFERDEARRIVGKLVYEYEDRIWEDVIWPETEG